MLRVPVKRNMVIAGGLASALSVLTLGSAFAANEMKTPGGSAIFVPITSGLAEVTERIGLDHEEEAPGTLDDGKDLLPNATISIEEAIAAASASAEGAVGELDLEYFDGRLVFNVDIGDFDVKVDAETGAVMGVTTDD